jgi:NADH-quinone oxidoreductase subunit M
MGVDGISMFFVLLSAFLTPVCIISAWDSIEKRVREYMVAFLVLECFMIGTFCALNSILFYVFFEGVLIPMFIIIGVWGGPRRVYSSYKFFLYTLAGFGVDADGPAGADGQNGLDGYSDIDGEPRRAVDADMAVAGVLRQLCGQDADVAGAYVAARCARRGADGGFGYSGGRAAENGRLWIPAVLAADHAGRERVFRSDMFWLGVIAIIYTSLVALVQEDMKKLVAYSSVAHMGYVTMGVFTGTVQGVEGGIFQMISHALISGALFLCVGVVYDRLHTREISRYGGIVGNMPLYAFIMMVFMLGSVGLPGTSGFIGEFLTLMGAFQINTLATLFASTGLVLGAAYMLLMYRRVVLGPPVNQDAIEMPDMNRREIALLFPIAAMVLWLGIFPNTVMDRIGPSVDKLVADYQKHVKIELEMTVDVEGKKEESAE